MWYRPLVAAGRAFRWAVGATSRGRDRFISLVSTFNSEAGDVADASQRSTTRSNVAVATGSTPPPVDPQSTGGCVIGGLRGGAGAGRVSRGRRRGGRHV